MNKNLTCSQVISLLEFYISGEINPKLKEYVDSHLASCPNCKQKVKDLQDLFSKFNVQENNDEKMAEESKYDFNFLTELSAYIDNELCAKDNIKIKKATVTNPDARQKLQNMYNFKKLLQSSYERTKKDYKKDYSKNVLASVINDQSYSTVCFKKLLILFCAIIFAIIVCFCYLYL